MKLTSYIGFFRMLLSSFLLCLFGSGTAFATPTASKFVLPERDLSAESVSPVLIPRSYLITLKKEDQISSFTPARDINSHTAFHRRAADLDFSVRHEFKNASLYYGLSIEVRQDLTESQILERLSEIPEVASVVPMQLIQPPKPVQGLPLPKINASGSAQFRAQASVLPKYNIPDDINSPLKMSDVHEVHKLGIKGKGIKIGVIDTGVDYRHPALGAGFGPGYKIAGGHAYYNDAGEDVESDDPFAICSGVLHGTHVAGIIGMQDPTTSGFGLLGVAPEASIYAYRVFPCDNGAPFDTILKALEKAADDGMDLVTMSLGSLGQFASIDPFEAITSSLVAHGIAVFAAAGNDGRNGLYYPSTPSTGPDVFSVGSVSNTKYPLVFTAYDSNHNSILYASIYPVSKPNPLSVYSIISCSAEAFSLAKAQISDPETTLVMILLGACELDLAVARLFDSGFTNNMLYAENSADPFGNDLISLGNNAPWNILYTDSKTASGMLSKLAKAGGYPKYTVRFDGLSSTGKLIDQGSAGLMSNFSSFSPSFDALALKPQASGPGGSILSTWGLEEGGYAILSGTSMATPFVAACYALLKSQYPRLPVATLYNMLQSTSRPLQYPYDRSVLSTVAHQGAGLININDAIGFETVISPSQLQLGDTDDFLGKFQKITITNMATQSKDYYITHQGAGYISFNPFPKNLTFWNSHRWGQPQEERSASVAFPSTTISVPGGKSFTFEVSIKPPADVDVSTNPIFSGFIQIHDKRERIRNVPYMGAPYSRKSSPVLATENLITGLGITPNPIVFCAFPTNTSRRIDGDLETYNFLTWRFYPSFIVQNIQPTLLLHLKLVPGDTSFVPDHYGFNKSHTFDYIKSKTAPTETFFGTPSYGRMSWNELSYRPPGTFEGAASDAGFFLEDGIPMYGDAGDYRIVAAALKAGGDENKLEDYDTWMSGVMRFSGVHSWEV